MNGEYQAVFGTSGGTVTLDPYTRRTGLTIQSGATGYVFSGGSLILTGSGIAAGESVTINSPLTFSTRRHGRWPPEDRFSSAGR